MLNIFIVYTYSTTILILLATRFTKVSSLLGHSGISCSDKAAIHITYLISTIISIT